jgi:hypothetical protein
VSAHSGTARRDDGEDGVIMILALAFLVSVSLTIGALLSLTNVNLVNTRGLQQTRGAEYAADAAVENAIQELRYQAPTNPITCPNFPTAGTSMLVNGVNTYYVTINNENITVKCTMGIPPQFFGRIVQFSACRVTASANCQANAIIQATVVFNDVQPGCQTSPPSSCAGFWGQGGVTVQQWNVNNASAP